jgi:hypothetical protein
MDDAHLAKRSDVHLVARQVLDWAALGALPQEPSSVEAPPVGKGADEVVTQILAQPARVRPGKSTHGLRVELVERCDGFGFRP